MSDTVKKESTQPLKVVGGFELIAKIGQGAMGAVFKARQISLDRIVALKILPPSIAKDTKFIDRFQREARACARLNHPNIVQGVDVGKDAASGVWYFAMELIDGPSVLSVIKAEGVIPELRALEIVRDVAHALECAASNGIVHRDIKPDNILLTSRGEAKLADLGLAKHVDDDASLTQSGQAVGTPYYMAPEQARGRSDQIDIRTDLYALGATLFHMVTGQPPYKGETGAVIMAMHLTEPVPRAKKANPDISDGCSRMIEQMMQKERERRIQTPGELVEQIERVMRGETGMKMPVNAGARRATQPRKKMEKEAAPKSGLKTPLVFVAGMMVLGAILVTCFIIPQLAGLRTKPLASTPPPKIQTPPPPAPKTPEEPVTKPVAVASTTPVLEAHETSDPSTHKLAKTEPISVPVPPPVVDVPKKTEQTLPVTVSTPTPLPAAPPPVTYDAWPLADIFAALKENAPKKAMDRIRDGNYAAKDEMLAALKLLDDQREARLTALKKMVGQTVQLGTTKGPQNGKVVAFKNNALQLEREMFINGEAKGASQSTVPMDDLLPATLEKLSPVPAPVSREDWVSAALTVMAAAQWENAETALSHLPDSELQKPLSEELKQTRIREREAHAKEAWAKIEARVAEPPTQSRAKQILDDLVVFIKKFADSDFASTPEIAAKMVDLKEKYDRLSLGLDPRVLKLFKGRILNYDARTQVITLGYDLQTKDQTEDFIDSVWAPPGDTTGLTWKKGELRTFCKGTADRVFKMPQFVSGTLNIQLGCKKNDTSKRSRFEFEVSFYGLDSNGKTAKTSFKADEKGCYFLNGGAELKSNLDEILFKTDGTLEVSCQGPGLIAKWDNKTVMEYLSPKPNDHSGFWIGGGWDSGVTFTKIQVSGRLDPSWLARALEASPKAR